MPNIVLLSGDGIGTEIIAEASRVLDRINEQYSLQITTQTCLIGGAAIDVKGEPLPEETLAKAKNADSVLLGAVGGPKWDSLPMDKRPEKGLLKIRAELDLFANLRPALLYPELASASTLKEDIVSGLDLLIVRELIGGIYFGEPRGIEGQPGRRVAITLTATQSQKSKGSDESHLTQRWHGIENFAPSIRQMFLKLPFFGAKSWNI